MQETFGYVIYSPCRTGSTLIRNNLQLITPNVIHTHSSSLVALRYNRICILSKRRNVFSEVLSHAVADVINEGYAYTDRLIEPFAIDPDVFISLYRAHKEFYNKIDTRLYARVVDIWFEQLLEDPYYLFRELGHTRATDYTAHTKSPRDYRTLVTNFDQLNEIAYRYTTKNIYP